MSIPLTAAAAALVAFSAACAPAGPRLSDTVPPPGVAGSTYRLEEARPSILEFPDATPEELWRVLPAAFDAAGIPANVMDRTARIYGNPQIRASSIGERPTRNLFRCTNEGVGVASFTQFRIEFGIAAQPRAVRDGGAELIVRTQAQGRFVDASRSGTVHCVSNGMMERTLRGHIIVELARIRSSGQGAAPSGE